MPSNLLTLTALLAASAGGGGVASAFKTPPAAAARRTPRTVRTELPAVERLHAPPDAAAGPAEHVYSLTDIDRVTRTVADDEWAALVSFSLSFVRARSRPLGLSSHPSRIVF